MAVKEVKRNYTLEEMPKEFSGLAADTATWQQANKDILPNGSTLKEVDGTKKTYQLHDGVWYDITVA